MMTLTVSSYQCVITACHTHIAPRQEGAGEPVTQRDETHRLLRKSEKQTNNIKEELILVTHSIEFVTYFLSKASNNDLNTSQ